MKGRSLFISRQRVIFTALLLLLSLVVGCPMAAPESGDGGTPDPSTLPSHRITTTTFVAGVEGENYTAPLNSNIRSTAAVTVEWRVDALTLPQGLVLESPHAKNATLRGIPEVGSAGDYEVYVELWVDDEPSDVKTIWLVVSSAPALTIIDGAVASEQEVGAIFALTPQVVGGTAPYSWSISNKPQWLTFIPFSLSCSLSGTLPSPQATEHISFELRVEDSSRPKLFTTTVISFDIVVRDLIVYARPATQSTQYSAVVEVRKFKNGVEPYSFHFSAVTFPTWLQFNDAQARISGMPAAPTWQPGKYEFKVEVTDSSTPAQKLETTASVELLEGVSITSPGLEEATEGQAGYLNRLIAAGGYLDPNGLSYYRWNKVSGDKLPIRIQEHGYVKGPPEGFGSSSDPWSLPIGASGTYHFRMRVLDANSASAEADMTWVIKPLPVEVHAPDVDVIDLEIDTARDATVGDTFIASGPKPIAWSIASGPAWLTLQSVTAPANAPWMEGSMGKLTVSRDIIATDAGEHAVTVKATDANGVPALRQYTIKVKGLDASTVYAGMSYWETLDQALPDHPTQWAVVPAAAGGMHELPSGLSLSATTGDVTGVTNASSGTSTVVIEITGTTTIRVAYNFTVQHLATGDAVYVTGLGGGTHAFDDSFDGITGNARGLWNTGQDGPALFGTYWTIAGIALDRQGNLYVSDIHHYAIVKIEADPVTGVAGPYSHWEILVGGEYHEGQGLTPPQGTFTTFLGDADFGGLDVDDAGNVYFCDWNSGRVYQYNATTHEVIRLAETGSLMDFAASGLAVTRDGSTVYVCGDQSELIKRINVATRIADEWTSVGGGARNYRSVALDSHGNLFVCKDFEGFNGGAPGGVYKINATTGVSTPFATSATLQGYTMVGSASGAISGLAIDASDNVYFTDSGNLVKVSPNGTATLMSTRVGGTSARLRCAPNDTLFFGGGNFPVSLIVR